MKRLIAATIALALSATTWSAEESVLNIYNWADYIGESTIADFTKETGIKVVYDMYASTEEMEAKMLAGSSGYDVVFTAGMSQPQMITAGVYQKLDRSRLPGWVNLDPEILRIVDGLIVNLRTEGFDEELHDHFCF